MSRYDNLITGRAARLPGDFARQQDSEAAPMAPDATAGHGATGNGLPAGAVAEFRFHRERKFRFDWAWPDRLVALEIEGGVYGRGKPCPTCGRRAVAGHSSIERLKTDMSKYNLAALAGWRVLRVTPQQFESGEAGRLVRLALATSVFRR